MFDNATLLSRNASVNSGALRQAPGVPRIGGLPSVRGRSRPICATMEHRNSVMYTDSNAEIPKDFERVGDVMTKGVLTVSSETPVLEALQIVVDKRITGLPVVDDNNRVVGVVSDFDLLALDRVSLQDGNFFPPPGQSWQTFNEIRRLIEKVEGQCVEDVMTSDPVVVRSETSLDAAAKLLLQSKIRRLPVVDKSGVLVGLLTRRDVVVAALRSREAQPSH